MVWKLLKMSHLNFWILAFSTNFCPIKTDLSGNTVWPLASGCQKLAKIDHFSHFHLTFVHSKCKRSSLRSQCWMRMKIFVDSFYVDNFCQICKNVDQTSFIAAGGGNKLLLLLLLKILYILWRTALFFSDFKMRFGLEQEQSCCYIAAIFSKS